MRFARPLAGNGRKPSVGVRSPTSARPSTRSAGGLPREVRPVRTMACRAGSSPSRAPSSSSARPRRFGLPYSTNARGPSAIENPTPCARRRPGSLGELHREVLRLVRRLRLLHAERDRAEDAEPEERRLALRDRLRVVDVALARTRAPRAPPPRACGGSRRASTRPIADLRPLVDDEAERGRVARAIELLARVDAGVEVAAREVEAEHRRARLLDLRSNASGSPGASRDSRASSASETTRFPSNEIDSTCVRGPSRKPERHVHDAPARVERHASCRGRPPRASPPRGSRRRSARRRASQARLVPGLARRRAPAGAPRGGARAGDGERASARARSAVAVVGRRLALLVEDGGELRAQRRRVALLDALEPHLAEPVAPPLLHVEDHRDDAAAPRPPPPRRAPSAYPRAR